MFFIMIFTVFFSATSMQGKYEHCKAEQFKGDYCKWQKKMSKY